MRSRPQVRAQPHCEVQVNSANKALSSQKDCPAPLKHATHAVRWLPNGLRREVPGSLCSSASRRRASRTRIRKRLPCGLVAATTISLSWHPVFGATKQEGKQAGHNGSEQQPSGHASPEKQMLPSRQAWTHCTYTSVPQSCLAPPDPACRGGWASHRPSLDRQQHSRDHRCSGFYPAAFGSTPARSAAWNEFCKELILPDTATT